jgi:5-methylcytosine-specific restriction endonuclease McrA
VAEVLERALDTLIAQLERQKVGSRTRSRTFQRILRHTRTIPPSVREAVWDRDQSRCTFVGANGRRCEARRLLEFDHVKPFARGGKATVDDLRLRCRAHNQYEAERVFGSEFMRKKRAQSRQEAARKKAARVAQAAKTPETSEPEVQNDPDPTRDAPE